MTANQSTTRSRDPPPIHADQSQKTRTEENQMKNYQDSDYALNKYSEGIVYRFADGSKLTVTLADYLTENPDKTEDDFLKLKELSDSDYLERDRSNYRQSWKDTSFDGLSETVLCSVPSPEAMIIDAPEEKERQLKRAALAKKAWDTLTKVQRRRYRMYHVKGMTTRKIAELDNVKHQSVVECLAAAEKKIKKFLAES